MVGPPRGQPRSRMKCAPRGAPIRNSRGARRDRRRVHGWTSAAEVMDDRERRASSANPAGRAMHARSRAVLPGARIPFFATA